MQEAQQKFPISRMKAAETAGDFSLSSFIRVVRRRKLALILAMSTCLGLAIAATVLPKKQYQATARILIDKQSTDSLNIADEAGAQLGGGDSMDYNMSLKSQMEILTSDTLALRVIRDLHLQKHLLGPQYTGSDSEAEESDSLRSAMLGAFHSRSKLKPIPGSRVVQVNYTDLDSKLATTIANELVKSYIANNFETKYEATQQASIWLEHQIGGLKEQIADSDQKLAGLQHKAGFFSESDRGNIELARLEELNNELLLAQSNRIARQAIYETARRGEIAIADQMDAGLAANTMPAQGAQAANTSDQSASGGMTGAVGTSSGAATTILQTLESHRSDLQIQYAKLAATYGKGYPRVQELQRELEEADKLIAHESQRSMDRLTAELDAAKRTEDAVRAAFATQRTQVVALNDIVVQYGFAKRDAEASNTLYTNLDAKLREAGVLAGLRSTNVSIIDPARPPISPISPSPTLNFAVGIFGGLFTGILLAFTLEHLDRNLRSIHEAETIADAKILTVVPNLAAVRERNTKGDTGAFIHPSEISMRAPASLQAEAFTTLRTAVLLSSIDRQAKVIMLTSALPGEGKSIVSINFSIALARRGAQVLLVEADLRRPSLGRYLKLPKSGGLSAVLLGQNTSELVQKLAESVPTLSVLTAGRSTISAPDLLASNKMRELVEQWRTQYDFVVVDTPPLLVVSDASIVARLADASLLVVRFSKISRQALARATQTFRNNHQKFLGMIVNDITPGQEEYYEYYGYDSHDGYHSEVDAMSRSKFIPLCFALCLAGTALYGQSSGSQSSGTGTDPTSASAPRSTAIQQSPPDAIVHPGDLITVSVFDLPDFTLSTRLSAAGDASFPLIGIVHLGDMSVSAVQEAIGKALLARNILFAPQVSVFINQSELQMASVLGAVKQPGPVVLLQPTLLTEVIARVGGLNPDGGDIAIVRRTDGGETAYRLGLDNGDDRNAMAKVLVNPGDTVTVQKADVYYALGDLVRPGGYASPNGTRVTALRLCALAWGYKDTASQTKIRVIRRSPNGAVTVFKLDGKKVSKGALPDLPLEPGDMVFVPTSALKETMDTIRALAINAVSPILYLAAP